MKPTDIQREEAYAKSSPAQKYLSASSYSGSQIMAIATKYDLVAEEIYIKFANIVCDVILGFYRVSDLPALLKQEIGLSEPIPNAISRDLLDFLSPLTDPDWKNPEATDQEVNTSLQSEIAATEAVIESLPQFRTMQTLASNDETVYTSTQSAILQEGAGLPVPPPPDQIEPRWDTSR